MFSKATFTSLVILASAAFSAPLAPRQTTSKRGICFDSGTDASLQYFDAPKISWAYNWGNKHWGGNPIPSNIQEFVPMCWGNKKTSNGWAECETLKDDILSGAQTHAHVLGFNEPDLPFPQSEMDPSTAVTMWNQYLQPLAGKTKLGAPATTNAGDVPGMGLQWLQPFLAQCQNCHFDFFPVHWYSRGFADFEAFKSYVQKVRQTVTDAGRPGKIWVTEVGVTGVDEAVAKEFMKKAIVWMEAPEQSYIERYSYYGVVPGDVSGSHMVSYDGAGNIVPNALGQAYMDV